MERIISVIAESDMSVNLIHNDQLNQNFCRRSRDCNGVYTYNLFFSPNNDVGGVSIDANGNTTNKRPPAAGLAHEFGHILEWLQPIFGAVKLRHGNLMKHKDRSNRKEIVSCIVENIYREAIGISPRVSYFYDNKTSPPNTENTELNYSMLDKIIMQTLLSDYVQEFINH